MDLSKPLNLENGQPKDSKIIWYALVANTIMIAESKPAEKEIMVKLIVNLMVRSE